MLFQGDMLQCQWGIVPMPLRVKPSHTVKGLQKAANIMDHKEFSNIGPFGICRSLANPMKIITPLGVIIPPPCIPKIPAPWINGSLKVRVNNFPAVTSSSRCFCAQGLGQIKLMVGIYPKVKAN